MRFALCDDQLLFIEALAAILQERGHEVPIVETDLGLLPDRLRATPIDVCAIDLMFASSTSAQTIKQLASSCYDTELVLLTAHPREGAVKTFGAVQVISKAYEIDTIVRLLEGAPGNSATASSSRMGPPAMSPPNISLTDRELAVLVALAQGANTKGLVGALGITSATARSYVHNILNKLGAHSRLQAVALALEAGLLEQTMFD